MEDVSSTKCRVPLLGWMIIAIWILYAVKLAAELVPLPISAFASLICSLSYLPGYFVHRVSSDIGESSGRQRFVSNDHACVVFRYLRSVL